MKTKARKKRTVRLAILGTGGMANVHAEQFGKIDGCEVVAAADVDRARAGAFGGKHGIPNIYAGAEELLAKAECEAVSIVTPDAFHAPLALQCLAAGKHVFCEKPLAVTYPDARRMVAAARKAGVMNMVNFSYRDWAAIQAVTDLVHRGGIGEVRHVEASYLQAWLVSKVWGDWRTTPAWLWRLSSRHGSHGALGDIGVHIVDFATYPAGPIASVYCRLKTFPKAPRNRVGAYQLDANDSAVMNVEFANGALGTIHTTRWCGGHANRVYLKISGTLGAVEIDSDHATGAYRVCSGRDLDQNVWRTITAPPTASNYQRFIAGIHSGKNGQPDFARGAQIQKVLDACFVSNAEKRAVKV